MSLFILKVWFQDASCTVSTHLHTPTHLYCIYTYRAIYICAICRRIAYGVCLYGNSMVQKRGEHILNENCEQKRTKIQIKTLFRLA